LTAVNEEQAAIKPAWWYSMHKEKYVDKCPKRGDIIMAPILSIGDHDISWN
jgi:hypothetical protein